MGKQGAGPTRFVAEFAVIVIGVFVALAADRWSQGRADAELERGYLSRLEDDIRADSLQAEAFLIETTSIDAATRSLLDFVDGGSPPEDLVRTIQASFQEMRLPAPATWSELVSTGSLALLRDPIVRGAVARYYGTERRGIEDNLARSDRRGRDRFMDALYPLGLFRASSGDSDTNCIGDVCMRPVEPEAFRGWPGMRDLLIGLDSGHGAQRIHARALILRSGEILRTLATPGSERLP